jgi:3-phosphoshikimate 1-carboxyvinyltransferase
VRRARDTMEFPDCVRRARTGMPIRLRKIFSLKEHRLSEPRAASVPLSASVTVLPARSIQGSLRLPGDKSTSHRYAMLAGFADGVSHLSNFSSGADPHSTLACMQSLGASVEKHPDGGLVITGCSGAFRQPEQHLDCGNSGSTMRMLAGLLAGQSIGCTLVGDASLSRRPMERIRTPLTSMGAEISLTDGHAPMTVRGGSLQGLDYAAPIASAQVKSALLFAGLQASGSTTVHETVTTRDHGELALRAFGAELTRQALAVSIRGGQKLHAVDATIPGDISSAAFFLCAAALFPDSNLILDGVGLNPTRASLLDVLRSLGLQLNVLDLNEAHGELMGTIQAVGNPLGLDGAEISGALAAQLIDELPVLAAIGPYTRSGIRIRDARELRVKESDRIALVARNLRAMGASVEEFEDGLDVPGNQTLQGAVIDSGDDHRIAMAFAVAALRAQGPSQISGAEAAAISFPEFFTWLDRIAER